MAALGSGSSGVPAGPPGPPGPPGPQGPAGSSRAAIEHELAAYKALADLFNSEETSFWARNNLLAALQLGLFAATVGIVGNSDKALTVGSIAGVAILHLFEWGLLVLFAVGLITALGWIFMVRRSELIADTISTELKEIEGELSGRSPPLLQGNFLAFSVFARELNPGTRTWNTPTKTLFNRYRLSNIWSVLGSLFAALWFLLFVLLALALAGNPTTGRDKGAHAVNASEAAASAAGLAASAAAASAQTAANSASSAQSSAVAAMTAASSANAAYRRLSSGHDCSERRCTRPDRAPSKRP